MAAHTMVPDAPSSPGPAVRGPKGLPILGNTLAFARDPLGFFERTAREYGDVVRLNFAGWPTLLLSDQTGIEKVLVKESRNFIKNEVMWRQVRALFGTGLLTSEGELWQRQRKLAAPAFAGAQLIGYGPDIVKLSEQEVSTWEDGPEVDIHANMMRMTLNIAAKAFFDSEVPKDIADVGEALDVLAHVLTSRFKRPILIPDSLPIPSNIGYNRAIRTVETIVRRMIEERRRTGLEGRTDFLSRFMAARDESGQPMSDKQLRDEAVTLLLAGHETTALTLSWSLHLLGTHPEVQARLADEIELALGSRSVTTDDLPQLKLAEGVVMEAMRLYPPAWMLGRQALGEFEIAGHTFGPGTTVFIAPLVLHKDPRYFDDPLAFRPERWLDGTLARSLPRFAYMPFGGGPRICVGQRFAMMSATMMLATIVRSWQVTRLPHRPVTPYPSITLRPEGGVWVRLARRQGADNRG